MNRILLAVVVMVVGSAVVRLYAQAETPAHHPVSTPSHDEAARPGPDGAAAAPGPAQEGGAHEGSAHAGSEHDAGPVAPDTRHRWPGVLIFIILVMFLMAAVIGPIVRAQAPPDMPPTHSHDEPPGASHHHGHTGTINPVPETVTDLEHGHDAHGH